MKNLALLKSAAVYAFNSTKRHLLRLLGYLVAGVIAATVCSFAISLVIYSYYYLFLKGLIVSNPLYALAVSIITAALIILYYVMVFYVFISGISILPGNLFDLFDGKPFRGFSDISVSRSFFTTTLFLFVILLLKIPGSYALNLHFNSRFAQMMWDNFPQSALFLMQYQWIFYVVCLAGIYLSARLDLAYFISLDSGKGFVASIQESWRLTKGRAIIFLTGFCTIYLFGHALSLFLPRINMLFSVLIIPFYMMFYIYLYRTLSKAE